MKPPVILVVDDSDLIRGVLTEFLEEHGCTVETAADGLEGFMAVYRVVPDLIISDVEMPRLQGYQMSRLLKSRREVRRIPVVMHTSLSEDRDRFWAESSGADAFITKDFDNLEGLLATIHNLLKTREPVDPRVIAEDAATLDERAAMEMLGTLFDRELFQSTILNRLSSLDKHIASLETTARELLVLLGTICESHVAVLVVWYNRDVRVYALPGPQVYREDTEGFLQICLRDFHRTTGPATGNSEVNVFNTEGRQDWEKTRVDGRRVSSYHMETLTGTGDEVIATLHTGNLTNNYFSERIVGHIHVFARGAGVVVENAVLFNTVNDMKHRINTMFSKFVPQEVIDELLHKKDDTELQIGEKRSVAILFSDIRSFTVISENNSAEDIVAFLNRYFNRMGAIIREHGGTIDKFIGDAILAVFGVPVSHEDNAERALRAALAMVEAIPEIDTGEMVLPDEGFATGIGIHEGSVIVGNIGSQDKFDYTVIGDNVNLASRLEGLTKHYHVPVIISDAVYHTIGNRIPVREVDTVRVKGKEHATTLYTAMPDHTAMPQGSPAIDEAAHEAYRKGIQMYRLRNWTTAIEYFDAVLHRYSDDFLSAMYRERCVAFLDAPPDDDWDGTVRLDFK